MSTLEEIFNTSKGRGPNGCQVCGAATEAAISVQIRQLGPKKGYKGKSRTVSVSLCAIHAVELWEKLSQEVP